MSDFHCIIIEYVYSDTRQFRAYIALQVHRLVDLSMLVVESFQSHMIKVQCLCDINFLATVLCRAVVHQKE